MILEIVLNCFVLNMKAMGLSAGSSLKYILSTDTSIILCIYLVGLGSNTFMNLGLAAFDQVCVCWGQGVLVADIPLQLCCEIKFK